MLSSKMRRGVGRRALLAGAASALAFPAIRARAQTAGVALVIGNSKYQWEASLPNVRRDAPDIAKRFQALGLQTEFVQDAGRAAMRQAVDKFASAARGTNFAAFYFAGHGAAWDKETYVVPVDADLSTPNEGKTLINVGYVRRSMADAAHRLWVWDNCRNNPADGWRQAAEERRGSVARGKDDIARIPNSLELYSTAPGRIALDGPAGQNSPFAAALLRQLEGQSIDLQALAAKLRRDLLIATEGRQVLFDRNSYQQPFLLSGSRGTAAPANRSGWSHDPARIIELPNAYAFARENDLSLVPGLIAHRPASNSPDGAKVGSYRFSANSPSGLTPAVLVVMSVEEKGSAELIAATKGPSGTFWRFTRGPLSGNRLEFALGVEGYHRIQFDWRDANSGTVANIDERPGRNASITSSRFTRLDG